uniref:Uncharacterized protein n=1 Tax=Tanacetum cinerariifolium TaxID=118510 RepID=A0A6L2L356_TANCI|nr:hypothetical protein [Tanacetum cinerariifolium]
MVGITAKEMMRRYKLTVGITMTDVLMQQLRLGQHNQRETPLFKKGTQSHYLTDYGVQTQAEQAQGQQWPLGYTQHRMDTSFLLLESSDSRCWIRCTRCLTRSRSCKISSRKSSNVRTCVSSKVMIIEAREPVRYEVLDGCDLVHVGSLPVAYGSSHVALVHRANHKAGQVLLVLGTGGGVGLVAVQISKVVAATVIVVAWGSKEPEKETKKGLEFGSWGQKVVCKNEGGWGAKKLVNDFEKEAGSGSS